MKYRSYRGRMVDMEELRRKHEKTVAAGNMGVNAKGDLLGPGGEVIEATRTRAKRHYSNTQTSRTVMSIKGDQEGKEEVFQEEEKRPKSKKPPAKRVDVTEVEDDLGNITLTEKAIDDEN